MFYCQVSQCGDQDILQSTATISDILSSLQGDDLDFEDIRPHFTKKEWEELKDIEKIRFKNLKSNHLFKLSIGTLKHDNTVMSAYCAELLKPRPTLSGFQEVKHHSFKP